VTPAKGIAKVEQIFEEKVLYPHEVRSLVTSLGNCQRPEAFDLLTRDVFAEGFGLQYQDTEWIKAIVQLDGTRAFHILLRFIDPDQTEPSY
jgi:hypothetical protein